MSLAARRRGGKLPNRSAEPYVRRPDVGRGGAESRSTQVQSRGSGWFSRRPAARGTNDGRRRASVRGRGVGLVASWPGEWRPVGLVCTSGDLSALKGISEFEAFCIINKSPLSFLLRKKFNYLFLTIDEVQFWSFNYQPDRIGVSMYRSRMYFIIFSSFKSQIWLQYSKYLFAIFQHL